MSYINVYCLKERSTIFDCEAISIISIIIYIMKNIAQTENRGVSYFKYFHEYFLLIRFLWISGKVSRKWCSIQICIINKYMNQRSVQNLARKLTLLSLCVVSHLVERDKEKTKRIDARFLPSEPGCSNEYPFLPSTCYPQRNREIRAFRSEHRPLHKLRSTISIVSHKL